MNHSLGMSSDSYYRVTEDELLSDYLKVADLLTISQENKLVLDNQRIKQDNMHLQLHKDEIDSKLKKLEPLLALKDTLIKQGLLKIS
jgi:hypothetical protein